MGHKLNPINLKLNKNFLSTGSVTFLKNEKNIHQNIEILKYIDTILKSSGCFKGFTSLKKTKDSIVILCTYALEEQNIINRRNLSTGLYYNLKKAKKKYRNRRFLYVKRYLFTKLIYSKRNLALPNLYEQNNISKFVPRQQKNKNEQPNYHNLYKQIPDTASFFL